jgi:hypothetical protein
MKNKLISYFLKTLTLKYEKTLEEILISSTEVFAAQKTWLFLLSFYLHFYKYICLIYLNLGVSSKNLIFCCLIFVMVVVVTYGKT